MYNKLFRDYLASLGRAVVSDIKKSVLCMSGPLANDVYAQASLVSIELSNESAKY